MLYNKEWEGSKDPLSLDSLIGWLEKQPAAADYEYESTHHCLLSQYFTAMGYENVRVMPTGFAHGSSKRPIGEDWRALPAGFSYIALGYCINSNNWTFGAALDRARSL